MVGVDDRPMRIDCRFAGPRQPLETIEIHRCSSVRYSHSLDVEPADCPIRSRDPIEPIDIVTLGETMLTIRPQAGDDTFAWEVGGAESNVARCCAALGVRTAWVSQLGTDLAGDLVLSTIREAGIDISNVHRIPDRQTGLMLKEANPNERRVWYYRRDSAAAAMSTTMPFTFTKKPKILHLTGITPALSPTCRALIDSLVADRTRAAVVSFDINWRPALWENKHDAAETLRAIANRCDLVFVGLDESEELWGVHTVHAVRDFLPQPDIIVVKDGANRGPRPRRRHLAPGACT